MVGFARFRVNVTLVIAMSDRVAADAFVRPTLSAFERGPQQNGCSTVTWTAAAFHSSALRRSTPLLLVPGLPGIGGRPDFCCGRNDAAMLRVGELQAENIAGQFNTAPGGLNPHPVI